ncbi:hypothetical protein HJG60_008830 [Phyllostomus discolor]|uniref:Uncharacterized protein n=1 Tax=Phyllostomus discolor TaxID=89673 RepID=A0A833YWD2_9CHIR|nr:hypothetical protein HJG60_008830 [Phyllostomus discolor]
MAAQSFQSAHGVLHRVEVWPVGGACYHESSFPLARRLRLRRSSTGPQATRPGRHRVRAGHVLFPAPSPVLTAFRWLTFCDNPYQVNPKPADVTLASSRRPAAGASMSVASWGSPCGSRPEC